MGKDKENGCQDPGNKETRILNLLDEADDHILKARGILCDIHLAIKKMKEQNK